MNVCMCMCVCECVYMNVCVCECVYMSMWMCGCVDVCGRWRVTHLMCSKLPPLTPVMARAYCMYETRKTQSML